ncbi:MAG: GNAT family N-acetyltransferase [Actinomycetota bacterium]|nr:GNAT family N-acetyltransferase [Actinomycetota bacterium]
MLDIVEFTDEHVDAAAELLAERHARHRAAEPLLPADVDFRAQIESEWMTEGASGVFAARDGKPAGYLLGRPHSHWFTVGIGGHALRGDAEQARDLYAAAAASWLDAGHREHAVFVPASDAPLLDAWFRLSFGASAALAIRETAPEPPFDAGVRIRPGTPDDLDVSWRLDRELSRSMVPAPSFSSMRLQSEPEYLEDWRDTWEDPQFVHFVAERDGAVVGHTLLYKRPADLRVPADSIDLANAATFPDLRGGGVGRALTAHVLAWAYEHGYPTMVTDWRMTNLPASRFWPRRGFRETFLRLHRAIP